MNINVTDLRSTLRRSSMNRRATERNIGDRRQGDRRVLHTEASNLKLNIKRIWLTPGERALIEDLYLLDNYDA